MEMQSDSEVLNDLIPLAAEEWLKKIRSR